MVKGIAHKDIDLLRDCLNSMLLVGTLVLSTRANSLSNQLDEDDQYDYGGRRLNLVAAFVNLVYLTFCFVFSIVDSLHFLVDSDSAPEAHSNLLYTNFGPDHQLSLTNHISSLIP